MTTESLAVVSIALSVVSLFIGVIALALVIAFKWSTHRIEYRPVESHDFPDPPEEEAEEELDKWGNPIIPESIKDFSKLGIDESDYV